MLLTVEQFAVTSVYLPGQSEVSTKFFNGFSTSGNSLEAGFEFGGKFKPVICGNVESLQDGWSSCVNGTALVVSDDSASPVDQFNVDNETENQAAWYGFCLLYTSPSPRDATLSRMPSSA